MRPARAVVVAAVLTIIGCSASHASKRTVTPVAATDGGVAQVESAPDAAPPLEPQDPMASYVYGRRERRDPNDLCEPVEENLHRAEGAITSDDRTRVGAASSRAWDRTTPPKYMDIIDRRYLLTANEKALLRQNGFVVPARLPTRGYADALHDIYQSQLPIFISSDAILHGIYKGNDSVLIETERVLLGNLREAIDKMEADLPGRNYPADVKSDVGIYLAVARGLLAQEPPVDLKGEEKALFDSAMAGTGGLQEVRLFGRARMIDWSQYTPRGHYAGDYELETWFRGTMWLSRLEFNLVSRKSRSSQPGFTPNPEETPREAVDALAVADLAEHAGALDAIGQVELAWTEFAGKREDVGLKELLRLKKAAGITTLAVPDSADKLKIAIGNDYQRTTRIHYMPQGSWPLPAIATMIGPRIVPDSQAETPLVHAHIADRAMPSFADVAFMLGNDRAKVWLEPDLKKFPGLDVALDDGRALLAKTAPSDLYSAWLASIGKIAAPLTGTAPSFTKTVAYQDFRVNSTVAAYGQIRHNYVLVAGQAYDEGGCEIPDGYVEPNVALYEALIAYAKRGQLASAALGGVGAEYFKRLEKTMGVLLAISRDELAGRPLSNEEKRYLSMTSEIVPPSSDGPGSYDGWYFGLFKDAHDAFLEHAFVADWFTSSNKNAVVYAGAKEPRLGFFVVDTNGEPRIMVGPVAHAFEHVGSLDGRLKDKDAGAIGDLKEPWAKSYVAPASKLAPLNILSAEYGQASFYLKSDRWVGPVTMELLDHHRTPFAKASANVGVGWTRIDIKKEDDQYADVLRVRWGGDSRELVMGWGEFNEGLAGAKELPWEQVEAIRKKMNKNDNSGDMAGTGGSSL